MGVYSIANRTIVTAIGTCYEIRTGSVNRCRVMEIGISLASAVASVIAVGRPAAIGVTPTGLQTVQQEDQGYPVGTVQSATGWTTAPTQPAAYMRRWAFPGTIGAGVIFQFPRGIVIPVSGSIVLYNVTANGAFDVHVTLEE